MQNHEAKKLLEQITGLYPGMKLLKDTAAIWGECLRDVSYEQARLNLVEHVKKSKFPPTIADIRGIARKNSIKIDNYCEVTGNYYEFYDPSKRRAMN